MKFLSISARFLLRIFILTQYLLNFKSDLLHFSMFVAMHNFGGILL
nr:MAG TPA: hypothetical protein [Caudoviricetes sp.]